MRRQHRARASTARARWWLSCQLPCAAACSQRAAQRVAMPSACASAARGRRSARWLPRWKVTNTAFAAYRDVQAAQRCSARRRTWRACVVSLRPFATKARIAASKTARRRSASPPQRLRSFPRSSARRYAHRARRGLPTHATAPPVPHTPRCSAHKPTAPGMKPQPAATAARTRGGGTSKRQPCAFRHA